jgi:hypothetical protein
MNITRFDIFSGTFGEVDARWLEAFESLALAYQKMNERAAKSPGKYFVFCRATHSVGSTIDTSPPRKDDRKLLATN